QTGLARPAGDRCVFWKTASCARQMFVTPDRAPLRGPATHIGYPGYGFPGSPVSGAPGMPRPPSGEFDGLGLDVLAERLEHLGDDALGIQPGAGIHRV